MVGTSNVGSVGGLAIAGNTIAAIGMRVHDGVAEAGSKEVHYYLLATLFGNMITVPVVVLMLPAMNKRNFC